MKIEVAILGATGTVGQKMIAMIDKFYPNISITEIAAGPNSFGKEYVEATHWREKTEMPNFIKKMKLKNCTEVTAPYILSALPSDMADTVEPHLANLGKIVISNASSFRMTKDIPLLIPEINGEHLKLIKNQKSSGKIITNPNCSTVFLAMGLAPLKQLGILKHVSVTTLQALSGAGYPGVSSLDATANIVPHIGGEEDKIENEVKKILGTPETYDNYPVTVHVHRVPIHHGHTVAIHALFENDVRVADAEKIYQDLEIKYPKAFKYHTAKDRPQPYYDLEDFDMRTHIGRLKQGGDSKTIGLIALGHNLVRGAAGAAIENLVYYLENGNIK
jgi:aspartate-semialdehyde dehydrogenase